MLLLWRQRICRPFLFHLWRVKRAFAAFIQVQLFAKSVNNLWPIDIDFFVSDVFKERVSGVIVDDFADVFS